ncbi:MAG: hypothetical protein QMC95_12965 [Desulfitobacteriaceae bacterium]|nr:hypothetical protein [Desulfitobacteriaceae bacterium]MDI6880511.1 hypothetical protein [Desulfitobacteriaceae bacterium]MDI6915110.1 hypothetical protein [Desulfitobacteriaceae bacterium]
MLWLPLPNQINERWQQDFPPVIVRLFEEYLRRWEELRRARKREALWLILLTLTGALALFVPWLPGHLWGSIGGFGLALAVFYRYRRVSSQVYHSLVNLNVLHHHLLGKLEVGFCNHVGPCECADEFRHHVWRKYHISLYGDPPGMG